MTRKGGNLQIHQAGAQPKPVNPKDRTEQVGKNKRLATEIALRLEEAERGNVVESHLRKVLGEISERVNSQRLEFAVTRTFLNDWADRAKRTKSSATALRYKGTIKKFLESLGSKSKAALADITPRDVQKFVSSRLEGGRNATTVIVDLKTLNAPFALAMRQGLILTTRCRDGCAEGGEGKPGTVHLGAGRQVDR